MKENKSLSGQVTNDDYVDDDASVTASNMIKAAIQETADDLQPSENANSAFRNKVKLFQTKKMMSKIFGEVGVERSEERKSRVEYHLGVNIKSNLN